ncbi:MAG: E2/UBC family protein [Pseudomonadota bacterium]
MTFLPEDDRIYLAEKEIRYELFSEETGPGSTRDAVMFPQFEFEGALFRLDGNLLVPAVRGDLLILIPSGYATTKLDSFYTIPRLKRADGTEPSAASGEQELFARKWQFWSRHLDDKDWRDGIDGLSTYLEYVRRELRVA